MIISQIKPIKHDSREDTNIKKKYSTWPSPKPEICREVTQRLINLHGKPKKHLDPLEAVDGCRGQISVLDSLIRTILSQNTTDITSIRAFRTLKEQFPTWEQVLQAPNDRIKDAIRVGGLAAIKTARIKEMLGTIKNKKNGECSLEWLRREDASTIKSYLSNFKGIGPKTISCLLLFCLDKPDFPVDTHVLHICKSLGFIPESASRIQAYEFLNDDKIPDDLKFDMHVLLVDHGKQCGGCSKSKKKGVLSPAECPLIDLKRNKKSNVFIPSVVNDAVHSSGLKRKAESILVKKEEDAI